MATILKMAGQNGIFLMGFLETELITEQRGLALDFPYLMPVLGAWEPSSLSPQLFQPCPCSQMACAVAAPGIGSFSREAAISSTRFRAPGKLLFLLVRTWRPSWWSLTMLRNRYARHSFCLGLGQATGQQKAFCHPPLPSERWRFAVRRKV